jgi:hypothetical protein
LLDVDDKINGMPTGFMLEQNRPNPFNPTTRLLFRLPLKTNVKIEIFDIQGQKITTLVDDLFEAGTHTILWNGANYATGVYLYKLTAGNFTDSKKMLLVK